MSPLLTDPVTVSMTESAPCKSQSPESTFQVTTTLTKSIAAAQFSSENSPNGGRSNAVDVPAASETASNPLVS